MKPYNYNKIFVYLFCILFFIFGLKTVITSISYESNLIINKSVIMKWDTERKSPKDFKQFIKLNNIYYKLPPKLTRERLTETKFENILVDMTENFIAIILINMLYIISGLLLLFCFVKIIDTEDYPYSKIPPVYYTIPLIFGIFPSLNLYTRNIHEFYFLHFLIITLLISIFLYGVFVLIRLITKNNGEALFLTSFMSVYFNFLKPVSDTFDIIMYFAILVFICRFLIKLDYDKLLKVLFFISSLLLIMNIFQYMSIAVKDINLSKPNENLNFSGLKTPEKDIYILILDQYASGNSLKEIAGFDNFEFTNALKQHGFYVNENMHSNYGRTRYSIPSLLNMDYIDNFYYRNRHAAISRNRLQSMANNTGYYTVYINNLQDFKVKKGEIINLSYNITNFIYTNITIANALSNSLYYHLINPLTRVSKSDNSVTWETLEKTISINKKKFVIMHILSPHEPYLHDRQGNLITKDNGMIGGPEIKTDVPKYIDYMLYTNIKTLEAVDLIFEKSHNPIIIIMGDHGIRHHRFNDDDKNNCQKIINEKGFIDSYFGTMMAYYNSDDNYDNYKDIKTSVNFMRKISNNIFGTKYRTLPDKLYYVYMDNQHGDIDFDAYKESIIDVTKKFTSH